MERDLEPERVVVVDHPAAAVGEDPALGGAAAERLDDLLDVEAGLDREDDALGDAEVRPGQDDLVDGLDRLAGADRADVGDRPAEGLRGRAGRARRRPRRRRRRSSGWRSARPRCRRRRARRPSATPRSREPRGEVPAPRRRDGRAVDDEAVRRGRPSATPSGPKRTASTSGVSETQMTTMSAARATVAPGVSAIVHAELLELGGAARRSGSSAVTAKPARARLAAIAAPIVPSPRNATEPCAMATPPPAMPDPTIMPPAPGRRAVPGQPTNVAMIAMSGGTSCSSAERAATGC